MDSLIEAPLVCICIPNYNNETTLSQTLDSLVNQTYKNIIIQVFDNASTDKSVCILRKYEEKYTNIEVFYNEKNIGGEANFSKCIEHMKGDFSAIYHSDDVYMPTIVEEEVLALLEHDISAVFTGGCVIDGSGRVTGNIKIPKEFMHTDGFFKLSFIELIFSNLKNDNFLICPTAMAKTKVYTDVIGQWDGRNYKTAADVDIWLRFAELNSIGVITKHLIKYRLSKNSFSFRRLKTRVSSKDFFLVMDDYISRTDVNKKVSKRLHDNYCFLKFKDHVVIERNSIINGIVTSNNIDIDFVVMKQSFDSFKNFLCVFAAILFKVFNYNKLLSRFVRLFK
ncbi:glycosyltransferase family 2 protein [Amphritea sp.]|uniref:glycosyltransferase family 2 protein n=1 Tax=Amphritea sp. TaxID=1872502 RepID=UPI0025BE0F73|nr:glycosyltransferase family 2 protein [Amphritea sp.]